MLEIEKNRPSFRCSKCNTVTKLAFDPRIDKKEWEEYVCPICTAKTFETIVPFLPY